jgi:O-antigen/teichoic acid export membrane protein
MSDRTVSGYQAYVTKVNVKKLLNSRAARQTGYLYASHLIVLFAGILINILNTRYLGPVEYGLYSFTFAVNEFITLFVDFGFYSSGARMLALAGNKQTQKELTAALLVLTLVLGTVSSALLFAISFLAASVFKADVGGILRIYCLFFGMMSVQGFVEALCRGKSEIGTLSLFQVAAKALCLVFIYAFVFLGTYDLRSAILFSLISILIAGIIVAFKSEPDFSGIRKSLAIVFSDVKIYGFKAYLGNIASTASYQTNGLLISYFIDATAVGFYRLSTLLTYPMITFSRSISTTLFKKFSGVSKMPASVLGLNLVWLVLCSLGLISLGGLIVVLLFGKKFEPVIPLILPMALSALFGGLAQPYNMFMGAKGKGSYLRDSAYILTGVNLLLNFVLIPKFGTIGACYASLIALIVNFGLHLFYYAKTVR